MKPIKTIEDAREVLKRVKTVKIDPETVDIISFNVNSIQLRIRTNLMVDIVDGYRYDPNRDINDIARYYILDLKGYIDVIEDK